MPLEIFHVRRFVVVVVVAIARFLSLDLLSKYCCRCLGWIFFSSFDSLKNVHFAHRTTKHDVQLEWRIGLYASFSSRLFPFRLIKPSILNSNKLYEFFKLHNSCFHLSWSCVTGRDFWLNRFTSVE